MRDGYQLEKLLRSIKNGIWMIGAILLIYLGLGLVGLRATPIAEIIMLLSFWGGLILFAFVVSSIIVDAFKTPKSKDTNAEQTASSNH